MIPQKKVISSSLTLDAIKTDKFKTETLFVGLAVPMSKELTPLYALTLSTLKRGTEKFPSQGDINRRLDELYATGVGIRLDRYGNVNLMGFSSEMLDVSYTDGKTDIFGGTLEVMIQMLFHPVLDENGLLLSRYVESEKDNVCDAIEAQINNPRAYASKRCREIMFGDDDYGAPLLGTVEQIRSVTAAQLTDVYRRLISGGEFRVSYVGSRSAEEVAEILKNKLLSYISNGRIKMQKKCSAFLGGASVKSVEEKKSLSQGKLVLGFTTGVTLAESDFYSMLVLSEIYGGSPVSKLFMNVREKLGLCYYCSAAYDIYKGVIFVSSGIDPQTRSQAEAEIFHQLQEIVNGNISQSEFDAAVKSLVGSYRSITDVPSALESYYSGRELFGLNCSVSEMIDRIESVSMEDVVRVAKLVKIDTVYFLYGDGDGDREWEDESDDIA